MRSETYEKPRKLRYGYTTGACATACSLAAAQLLLCESNPDKKARLKPIVTVLNKHSEAKINTQQSIEITLPKGQNVKFALEYCQLSPHGAIAATCKDAGDDPDVTHRAIIMVEVRLKSTQGVDFQAGEGVGIITRKGLPIGVGEAAINPIPRKMMQQHLHYLAQQQHYSGGFTLIIGVKNGLALAKKTLNARLGILGGLSILGTTGIVRPFSCSAYIASIHRAIDVADANQIQHIAACTGSGSEQMIQAHYQLSEMALIEMGDFVGAVLKYLKKVPIAKLSIVGGFGKMTKLAAGHLDLHSRKSTIDFDFLATVATKDLVAEQKETQILYQAIQHCNTSIEALQLCQSQQIDLASRICEYALITAKRYVPQAIEVEVFAINRRNEQVGLATTSVQ